MDDGRARRAMGGRRGPARRTAGGAGLDDFSFQTKFLSRMGSSRMRGIVVVVVAGRESDGGKDESDEEEEGRREEHRRLEVGRGGRGKERRE